MNTPLQTCTPLAHAYAPGKAERSYKSDDRTTKQAEPPEPPMRIGHGFDTHFVSGDGSVNRKARWASITGGVMVTAFLFIVIPFTQFISGKGQSDLDSRMNLVLQPPPPPIDLVEPPPPEQKKEQDEIKLEQETPRISLSQLEAALNPGTGGAITGDFSMSLSAMAADDLDRIFELTEIDRAPVPVYQVSPVYPYALSRAGINGLVNFLFVVDTNGRVQHVKVLDSTRREFEKPATDALLQWRFEPGVKNGARVSVRMSVPIVFKLLE